MTEAAPPRRRGRLVVVALLAAALLLFGGIALGRVTAPSTPSTPSTTSAEAGFARDMQTHHNQGVELAMIIYAKTSDAAIRTLSYDIATSQAQQSGQMFGWLSTWGLSQAAPEPSMTWMSRPTTVDGADDMNGMTGMGGSAGSDAGASANPSASAMPMHQPGEPMPGLATAAQVDELQQATGAAADRLFLTLMIAHHRGAIEMADAVLARSTDPQVVSLARGILTTQQSDIDYMTELLG